MSNNEFGDFQTPIELAAALVDALPERDWARIVEPTCGTGSFLRAARCAFPAAELVGIEIQDAHADRAERIAPVLRANIFDVDLGGLPWRGDDGPLLVLGNPPWVTNAELSRFGSDNRPQRNNFRTDRGIDAVTGRSNFDTAEAVWLHLLRALAGRDSTIALLCKTQVARNVLLHCARYDIAVASAELRRIDASRWFGASVDACWFVVRLGTPAGRYRVPVYPDLGARHPEHTIGVLGGRLVRDLDGYLRHRDLDGTGPIAWRQGVKHDAAAVLELLDDDGPVTRAGEPVDVEPEFLFPLFKCSDVHRDRLRTPARWLVVPQRHPADPTDRLATAAPRLWEYLCRNGVALDGRRSRIYRGRHRFAIFGVGPYTFAPYKVAISGLHKEPAFRTVGPFGERPAVFDDTTYLLPFDDAAECAVAHAVLDGPEVRAFVAAIAFPDSKRPVTKSLLQRIDLAAALRVADPAGVRARTAVQLDRLGCTTDPHAAVTTAAARWTRP